MRLKKAFLDDFQHTGNITESSENVGIHRNTIYNWQEQDDEFAAGFREAEVRATERLETEARRRAVDGVLRLKFDKGVAIIDPRTGEPYLEAEKSDTLLIFLLKARAPDKYRDNVSVTLQVKAEAERIAAKLGKTAEEVLALAGVSGGR